MHYILRIQSLQDIKPKNKTKQRKMPWVLLYSVLAFLLCFYELEW